jgi:adenylate cyclase
VLKSEAAIRNLIGEFELGRLAYRNQEWEKCRKHFMACLQLRPDDGPANLFLERVEERAAQPSIPNWDGVYVAKTK